MYIGSLIATVFHFAKCNKAGCNHLFMIDPTEKPGELGFLCPNCTAKTITHHTVVCSSCNTVINFVGALKTEEKVCFTVDKCSHCVGSVEDEYSVQPIYAAESYI